MVGGRPTTARVSLCAARQLHLNLPFPPSRAPQSESPQNARRPLQASNVSVIAAAAPGRARPPIPLEILPAGEFEPVYR